ncbi:hypothetical protein V1478_003127 [Vespula squamosa]|uniref:Secreted protein n=1 Tax=Vespula squamosa TaxID=30214 RepID=A0ABD2BRT4_VESSQ
MNYNHLLPLIKLWFNLKLALVIWHRAYSRHSHANPPRINLEKQGNVIESPSFVGKTRFHVYTRANQRVSSQDAVLKSELHDFNRK